jgi:hypothetical protein
VTRPHGHTHAHARAQGGAEAHAHSKAAHRTLSALRVGRVREPGAPAVGDALRDLPAPACDEDGGAAVERLCGVDASRAIAFQARTQREQ